jgi:hypothetical protein
MSESHVEEIHARYTYRMHSLSEFMKALLIASRAGSTARTSAAGPCGRSASRA